jgi:hypothetical protein
MTNTAGKTAVDAIWQALRHFATLQLASWSLRLPGKDDLGMKVISAVPDAGVSAVPADPGYLRTEFS